MTDIRIADYDVSMADKIYRLFTDIYPNHPDITNKMCYEPTRKDHVATKAAYLGEDIVGQANIFLCKDLYLSANLGFHVHPSTRNLGIATDLSGEALKVAQSKGISVFYLRTHEDNFAAIAVARKLGFTRDDMRFTDKGIAVFIKKN
jgi:RimJ/RimL family protein N-acetyltransferase